MAVFLASAAICRGATVTLLPPTPYLRFTDSPFHAAAAAGDALKFTDIACNDPAATLSDGFGVHDTFVDPDCISPWVQLTRGTYNRGTAVDEENGLQGDPGGWYIFGQSLGGPTLIIEFTFVTTSDGRFPSWLGFVATGSGQPVTADILGVGNSILASIDLFSHFGGRIDGRIVSDDRFVGIQSTTPIHGLRITGDFALDDLTYGYGTPIPEPASGLLAAGIGTAALFRRRRHRELTPWRGANK